MIRNIKLLLANLILGFSALSIMIFFLIYFRLSIYHRNIIDQSMVSNCDQGRVSYTNYVNHIPYMESLMFVLGIVCTSIVLVEIFLTAFRINKQISKTCLQRMYILILITTWIGFLSSGTLTVHIAKAIWVLVTALQCSTSPESVQNYKNALIIQIIASGVTFIFMIVILIIETQHEKKEQVVLLKVIQVSEDVSQDILLQDKQKFEHESNQEKNSNAANTSPPNTAMKRSRIFGRIIKPVQSKPVQTDEVINLQKQEESLSKDSPKVKKTYFLNRQQ